MFPIALDTALNLAWLGVGVIALIAFALLERRSFAGSSRPARLRRLFTVLIITIALFPSVSSSDDLFSFSLINSQLGRHGGFGGTIPEDSKEKAGMQLARLLETLNHYQISDVFTIALFLCCIAFVLALRHDVFTRIVVCSSGRAPPPLN
jgi:hypothetical protein